MPRPTVALALVVAALVAHLHMLRYTRIGLDLKAVGRNPSVASHGLKPSRPMVPAMLFAGGFAGLAGNLQVTAVYHRLIPAISSNYGSSRTARADAANYNIWLVRRWPFSSPV